MDSVYFLGELVSLLAVFPPLASQESIAGEVTRVQAEVERCKAELEKVPC